MKEREAQLGYRFIGGSPDELATFLKAEIAKWDGWQEGLVQVPTEGEAAMRPRPIVCALLIAAGSRSASARLLGAGLSDPAR